jgi:hypothetical protein
LRARVFSHSPMATISAGYRGQSSLSMKHATGCFVT